MPLSAYTAAAEAAPLKRQRRLVERNINEYTLRPHTHTCTPP